MHFNHHCTREWQRTGWPNHTVRKNQGPRLARLYYSLNPTKHAFNFKFIFKQFIVSSMVVLMFEIKHL